jgi:hypothetical protein
MSAMSVGKMPKALFHPLRAGNSRTGKQPGQFRAGEPATAASRPDMRNVPGVPGPAHRDMGRPARPRVARKSPARPRLWAVPDAPRPAGRGDGAGTPVTSEPASSRPAASGPVDPRPVSPRSVSPRSVSPRSVSTGGVGSGQVSTPPAGARPGAPGSRMPGEAPPRRPREESDIPLVPRPRVAPDDQIPGHPGIPPAAPGRPRGTGPGGAPTRTRVVRPASAPSRVPVRRARRTRLTRRGRRLAWASAVLLVVAVITPILLAVASGAQAANHGVPPSAVRAGMRHVVVKSGESLWSIALHAEPSADPRVVVQQIIDYNALGSQVVVPGEGLWVPRG